MVTQVLRCKLYPGATPWRNIRSARPFHGGGLTLRAIVRLDRWLSRQNPAYRPASRTTPHRSLGAGLCYLLVKQFWHSTVLGAFSHPHFEHVHQNDAGAAGLTPLLFACTACCPAGVGDEDTGAFSYPDAFPSHLPDTWRSMLTTRSTSSPKAYSRSAVKCPTIKPARAPKKRRVNTASPSRNNPAMTAPAIAKMII